MQKCSICGQKITDSTKSLYLFDGVKPASPVLLEEQICSKCSGEVREIVGEMKSRHLIMTEEIEKVVKAMVHNLADTALLKQAIEDLNQGMPVRIWRSPLLTNHSISAAEWAKAVTDLIRFGYMRACLGGTEGKTPEFDINPKIMMLEPWKEASLLWNSIELCPACGRFKPRSQMRTCKGCERLICDDCMTDSLYAGEDGEKRCHECVNDELAEFEKVIYDTVQAVKKEEDHEM